MIKTHAKKRLEIIVEAPVLARLLDKLDQVKVPGYTVLPALSGRGLDGSWSREGLAGDAGRMVAVICILDATRVDNVLEVIQALLARQIGILSISDVEVIRAEHF
jgi:nitrogen regulatory protein PII